MVLLGMQLGGSRSFWKFWGRRLEAAWKAFWDADLDLVSDSDAAASSIPSAQTELLVNPGKFGSTVSQTSSTTACSELSRSFDDKVQAFAATSPFASPALKELVGRGSFGMVFRAADESGKEFAIKVIDWRCQAFNTFKGTPDCESRLMEQLVHPNIVRSVKHYTTDCSIRKETWIVQEWCNGGTLHSHCTRAKSLRETAEVCADICAGGGYLHSMNVIHADLTANNVLMCVGDDCGHQKGYMCKIADFGMARVLSESPYLMSSQLGTVTHMPPELFEIDDDNSRNRLSMKMDVYALGILIYQVFLGEVPYKGKSTQRVAIEVSSGKIVKLPPTAPPQLVDVFNRCTSAKSQHRPTFVELQDAFIDMLKTD
jgi:serine/threonine protein kinase